MGAQQAYQWMYHFDPVDLPVEVTSGPSKPTNGGSADLPVDMPSGPSRLTSGCIITTHRLNQWGHCQDPAGFSNGGPADLPVDVSSGPSDKAVPVSSVTAHE